MKNFGFKVSTTNLKLRALSVNCKFIAVAFGFVLVPARGQFNISGIVSELEGVHVPGVVIVEKGTNNGTTTDMEGKFALVVKSADSVLSVTAFGMKTIERPVSATAIQDVMLEAVNSKLFPVTGHRGYRVFVTGAASSDIKQIRIQIAQFTKGYPAAEQPIAQSALEIGEGRAPSGKGERDFETMYEFYQRQGNDRVRVAVTSLPGLRIKELRLVTIGGVKAPTEPLKDALPPPSIAEEAVSRATATSNYVKHVNGRSRLWYGADRVEPFIGDGPWRYSPDDGIDHWKALSLAKVPTHVVVVPCESEYGIENAFWKGRGKYDYAVLEKRVRNYLRSNPDGKVILQILVDPYNDWGRENPSEVCLDQKGRKGIGKMRVLRWGGEPIVNKAARVDREAPGANGDRPGVDERFLPSLYSMKVREEILEMVRHLVGYVETSGLKDVVTGYALSGFCDAQFVNWGWGPVDGGMDDYSLPARESFQMWLRRKYQSQESTLRESWKDPAVTFEAASIPPVEVRRQKGLWLDWRNMESVADFNRFYAEAPMDLPIAVSEEIKKITHRKKVVVSYFASAMNGWPTGAALEKMLEQESIDMFAAPADYWIRLPGYPGGCQSMPESVALHEKLYLTEQDWRSYTAEPVSDDWDFFAGRARNKDELSAMIRRESGMMIAHGQGAWGPVHVMYPNETSEVLGEVMNVFKRDLVGDEPLHADVAFFVGERSLDYLTNDKGIDFRWYLLRRQRDQWNTSGVPYHLYLQSDLIHSRLPDYKVYVFVSPQHLSVAEQKRIEELKSNGRTLVFLHGPGVIGAQDPAVAVSTITGIKVRGLPDEEKFMGEWIPGSGRLVGSLTGSFGDRPRRGLFGNAVIKSSAFEVTDTEATPLARYRESRAVAFATRDFGTWRSIFCGIPFLEAGFINNLANEARAWVAAPPNDAVYANQRIITIHAISSGMKHLQLLKPSSVTDLTSGLPVSLNTERIEIDMKQGETKWFWLEPTSVSRKRP